MKFEFLHSKIKKHIMNAMTAFPNGSTSITFCHSRSGKRSIEIKLSQDYINMCNMENKQNTQIHKKRKNYKL